MNLNIVSKIKTYINHDKIMVEQSKEDFKQAKMFNLELKNRIDQMQAHLDGEGSWFLKLKEGSKNDKQLCN